MLCGLPGVGKTHWVEKWVREHPEKRYTVLGTHELVNRMKVFLCIYLLVYTRLLINI